MNKIISIEHKDNTLNVNEVFKSCKYAIPECEPIKLSNGNWMHIYKVTPYGRETDENYNDIDEIEEDTFNRELYG